MVWCRYPYSSMSLDLEGHYRLCCEGMQMPESYMTHSPKDFLNSTRMKRIQQVMKDGDPYQDKEILHYCQRCIRSEKENGTSRRITQGANEDLHNTFSLQISGFGNKCNLMCNHCSSHLSSKWSHFAEELRNTDYLDLVDSERYSNKSYLEFPLTNEQLFTSLVDFINENVERLTLSGGEVLLTKKGQDLLQRVNTDKDIQVATNASLDNRIYQKFYNINPNIQYNISFDGLYDIHELIRTESKWHIYNSNIDWFNSKNIKIGALLSLQSLNILQLKEICEYSKKFQKFNYHFVYGPEHLCIKNMHPMAKEKAIKVLESIKDSPINLQPIYDLLQKPYDHKEWKKLLRWLAMYKKILNKTISYEEYVE